MMVILGWLNFFYGLAAILNDSVFVVGGHGAIIADITTWSVITLILAVILMWTGYGLLTGGVVVAGLMLALPISASASGRPARAA